VSRTCRIAAAVLLGLPWFAETMWSQTPVLSYATRLAGTGHDSVAGIAVDRDGNTWIAGTTSSLDFPTLRAKQPRPAGSSFLRIDGTAWSWGFDTSVTLPFALAASATVPDLVYASDSNGLHKSTDGGDTWALVAAQPSAHPPAALAMDSTTAAVVYTASVDGIFKSSDGGASWSRADQGVVRSSFITQIAVDPFDAQLVFAVINSTLFRSSDGGVTWTSVLQQATSIQFDLGRPGVVFVSAAGVYKSADHGAHWTRQGASGGYSPVFPDPFHPGVLYSSFAKSTDEGVTWTSLPGFGSYAPFFAADFSSRSVYASFGTVMVRSEDAFAHQETVSPPSVPFMRVFGTGAGRAPGSPLRIYAATEIASDLFVAKLDPSGSLLYSSYLGGSSGESATALAVDPAGNVYVTGLTSSLDFPVTPGAYGTTFQDAQEPQLASLPVKSAFVVKLNPDGDVVYSTFFAGRCTSPTAIAVDAGGSVFLTGSTSGNLPVTPGAFQSNMSPSLNGFPCDRVFSTKFQPHPVNAFMARFDPSGASLQSSTYLGAIQEGDAVAVDSSGEVYVGGGNTVMAVDAAGSTLLRSTHFDGASIRTLALDSSRNLYIAGSTQSSAFPATPGAVQRPGPALPQLPGGFAGVGPGDVFVAKLAPDFSILHSSVFGGEGVDAARALAIDSSGNVTIAGATGSRTFPLSKPFQSIFNTTTGFVARLSVDFSNLDYSTYVGNQQGFFPVGVALDRGGNPVFSGYTLAPGIANLNEGPPFPDNATAVWVARLAVLPAGALVLDNVVNAASRYSGAIAPNETIAVLGSGFEEGSQLLLDGNPLAPVSQKSTEFIAVVPSSYQGASNAVVEVKTADGRLSNRFLLPVAAVSVGLYSVDGSGFGPGYILNADGTRNSPDNPTAEGSVITIVATGVGVTTKVNQTDVTASPASVFIDGFYANGVDARVGPLPGFPSDVYQLKIIVPRPSDFANINPNLKGFKIPPTVGVVLNLGGSSSQAGVSLSVR
jgi:uncharacterized protein (TIGR03437 family)